MASTDQAGASGGDWRPSRRRAAFVFIFVTVMLDMLALGVVVPVLPALVIQLAGGNAVRGAEVIGLFGTVWALMQFICSPAIGSLSDHFGRRPVVLISNFGLGLDYLVMALAPSLSWLFVGRVINGITSASFSTAGAYIADVTPPEKRAANFGMLTVAFGLGFILGPAIGGLLGTYGTRLPFWVAAGLSLANAMYGLFVLPESLPPERRERFKWRRSNPLGSIELLRSDAQLFRLGVVNFIGSVVHEALPTLFVIYAGYRYGWGTREAGLAIAVVGVCSAAVGGGLVKPLVARVGERTTMLLGLAFGAIGFGLYGIAVTGLIFCIAIPVNSLWGLWGPPMQGIMTQRVKETEQGQLQGALGSFRGIGMLIGPGLFTASFAFAIARGGRSLAGAPFILAAILLFGAMMVAWRATGSPQALRDESAAAGS